MGEIKRNSKGEKLYPFSMGKHGHDVLLAYNAQKLMCWDMLDGVRKMNSKAFEIRDMLGELLANYQSEKVAWVTGEELNTLKLCVFFADDFRSGKQ